MAREKPLDFNIVQAWLAAWDETELYSDAAVRHLATLIEDLHCLVVVTRGVSREARSLVFRRCRFRQPHGAQIRVGQARDEPIIVIRGKQRCSFMEALACAHELAEWGKEQVIYTYDDSTWGSA